MKYFLLMRCLSTTLNLQGQSAWDKGSQSIENGLLPGLQEEGKPFVKFYLALLKP